MKRTSIFILCLMLLCISAQAGNRVKELSRSGQLPFHPPKVDEVTLSNGMKVFWLEDHDIPIVQARMVIKGGGIYEDMDKVGVGAVMAGLLKEGGTLKNSPEKIRELLDQNAIDASFVTSLESIEGYLGSLSKDSDTAFKLFFEMLFEPAFNEEGLSNVKKKAIDGLKREMEISGPIAQRRFREMLYGEKNPWGVVPKGSIIKKLTRQDVVNYYNRFFSPDRMILAVAGDFNKKELLKKLEAYAKLYPAKELPMVIEPKVVDIDSPERKFIKKKFTQSAINMGHFGSTRNNPDKYAIIVMNYILGGSGSFTNRLLNELRVKGGLVYQIFSDYSFGPDGAPGYFMIHAKTRNQNADKAVAMAIREIEKIYSGEISEDEVKKAKEGMLNNLVFEYEKPFDVVSGTARFVYFGFPKDYIEIYKKKIEAVKLEDVKAAAKKYLHPDELKIVVVGGKE